MWSAGKLGIQKVSANQKGQKIKGAAQRWSGFYILPRKTTVPAWRACNTCPRLCSQAANPSSSLSPPGLPKVLEVHRWGKRIWQNITSHVSRNLTPVTCPRIFSSSSLGRTKNITSWCQNWTPTGGTLNYVHQVISSCSTLSQTWQKFSISRCQKSKNLGVPLPSSMARGSKIGWPKMEWHPAFLNNFILHCWLCQIIPIISTLLYSYSIIWYAHILVDVI